MKIIINHYKDCFFCFFSRKSRFCFFDDGNNVSFFCFVNVVVVVVVVFQDGLPWYLKVISL